MVSNVTDISDKVVIIEICSRQVTILLLETCSIRFFDGKPQTPKYHVTTALRSLLQIAVHVWTAGRASSGKWFTARIFLPLKIVQILVLRHELAFYIRLRCVRWIFDLESMNYFCFLTIKVMHFDLMKNNMAALNNERVVQIDFIFLSAILT